MKLFVLTALLLSLLLMQIPANADPIINKMKFGPSITMCTINGTGFETKNPAAPVKQDNFQKGILGYDIGNGWTTWYGWRPPCKPVKPIYVSRPARYLNDKSIDCLFKSVEHCPPVGEFTNSFGFILDSLGTTNALNTIYLDYWEYYAPGERPSRNHKTVRLYHFPNQWPYVCTTIFCRSTSTYLISTQCGPPDGGCGKAIYFGPTLPNYRDQWHHWQLYLRASDPGTSNGIVKVWLDHTLMVDQTNWKTCTNTNPGPWNWLEFGHFSEMDSCTYHQHWPTDAHTFWSEVYVDTTQARVEIGNMPIYSACTHREIQKPNYWSDTMVSFFLNLGSFVMSDNIYIFVITADGEVSNGLLMQKPRGSLFNGTITNKNKAQR